MNINMGTVTVLLIVAAIAQLAIAGLNLRLVRILDWKEPLRQIPLLLREVFYVHSWFISVTLTIFGVLTLRFAPEMSSNPVARWLAVAIGCFWGFRTLLQVGYYSSTHWRGNLRRTIIHVVLLVIYGGMTVTYLLAGLQTKGAL